jgi:inorganic pyrophosphatase
MTQMIFDVVIEIPAGSRNKYEIDHKTGEIRLDRMLFTSTRYPYDYGFVKNSLSLDGDPLDALVILDEPTFPGCVVSCRVVGMYHMQDEAGGDDKLLCVAAGDIRKNDLQDLDDVAEYDLSEISHFFQVYKALEPGKKVFGGEWVGHAAAENEINASYKRYKESH